jgi:hypothetical protein
MANNATLYSYCSTFNVGCPVWTTPDRTVVANPGIYSAFDYSLQGTRYITVANGVITSINNLCPIGPGSVIATQSLYTTPIFGEVPESGGIAFIEVARGENSTTLTPFHSAGKDWIEAKSSTNGQFIYAIRNLMVPESGGRVERSLDSGATFNIITSGMTPTHNPVAIAMDETADTVVVVTQNGYIYHNLGPYFTNFISSAVPGIRNWKAVAVSAAGNVIIAAAEDGTVWRTTRSQIAQGNTNKGWVQSNVGGGSNSWTSIAINRLGSVIWLVGNNTHLYLSQNGGLSFVQVPITVTVPNIGNISSPFNFSNIATDNLGNNTVATVEPSSNSSNLGFIAKNFITGSVNYNNWSWGWGFTGVFPYNNIVNGNWTGLAVSSNAATVYAVNNHPTKGGFYFSQDNASTFYTTGGVSPYTSISYVRNQTCPANGTLLEEYCEGSILISIYANGTCGTYATTEYNSPSCQPLECNTYSVSDFGYVSYVDCNGDDQFIYYSPGDFFCARTYNYGPAYEYARGCDGVPGGGIA